jgi:hypothetical protein
MKKINTMLHDEKVQGNLIIASIFLALAVVIALTWGK